MKAVVLARTGGPDVLRVEDWPTPLPDFRGQRENR